MEYSRDRVAVLESRRILLEVGLIILSIISIIGLVWINGQVSERYSGGNEFLARWMAAHFWLKEGISPYNEQVSQAAQEMIYGHPANPSKGEDNNGLLYPLNSMLLLAPFGIFEYKTALSLWMTLLEISAVILATVSMNLVGWRVKSPYALTILVLFSLLWYPSLRTITIGHAGGLAALLIIGSLLLILSRQDLMAGILISLSTIEPQMCLLILPFVFLWAFSVHRNDIIYGILIGLVGSMAITLMLLPQWPIQWIRQLIEYLPHTSGTGSVVALIASATPGISRPVGFILYAIFLAYLFMEWVLAWGKDERWFLWTSLMTLVVSTFVAFRMTTAQFSILLPVVFLMFAVWEDRWGKIGGWVIGIGILVLFAGQWALFFMTVQGNQEQSIMYLPLPIICLIGLWWVKWWVIRPPKMSIEKLSERF